ncbi:MAG TPA: response regulator transcription factor [Desulfuromonadaceae bacterium]|nr:response regulator transcription factor [Desulfuromonadaceae bacterium]
MPVTHTTAHRDRPITVSIVEDKAETREMLASMLKNAPGLQCVGVHESAEAALKGIPQEKPDVALVDIHLPGINGIECVSRLKSKMPRLQLLILTRFDESELIFEALRAGASGYLLKKSSPEEIFGAIAQIHAGGAAMSMHVARKVANHFYKIEKPNSEMDKLSQREYEVLSLLAKGYLYKEIADQLGIGLGSVRTYILRIYEKLHVQSRGQAAAKFFGNEPSP